MARQRCSPEPWREGAHADDLEMAMNMNFRKIALLLLVAAFAFSTTACNTMKGLGKDTEKAGEKIQKEADRSHTTDDSTRS